MTELTDSAMTAEPSTLSSSIAGEAKHSGHKMGAALIFEEHVMLMGIPLGILGLLGNGIVSCLFCYLVKFSRFALYFQNIVIANITVLMNHFIFTFVIYLDLNIDLFFLRVVEMLEILGYNTRFYLLTAICVERCSLIFFPVWDKRYRPRHFSVMVSGIFWALSCFVTVVQNLACLPNLHTTEDFAVSCTAISTLIIIIDLVVFLIMIFSTLAILIRMQSQQSSPARLDITIVATVLLFLLTDTPIRMTNVSSFWIETVDLFLLNIMIHLLDTANCTIVPFIFVIVGRWKNPSEPIKEFLVRALQVEENMAEKTPTDQE